MERACCICRTCQMKLETVCGLEEIRVAGTRGIAKVEGSTDLFRRDPSGRHSGSVLRHTNSRRLYENRDELQDDEMVHGAWRQAMRPTWTTKRIISTSIPSTYLRWFANLCRSPFYS